MISSNMNKNGEKTKLLAVIAVFAMVACALVAFAPSADAAVNSYSDDVFEITAPEYDNIVFDGGTDGTTIVATGYAGIADSKETIGNTTFGADYGEPGAGFGYLLLKVTLPENATNISYKLTSAALAGFSDDGRVQAVQGNEGYYYKEITSGLTAAKLAAGDSFLIPTDSTKAIVTFEIKYTVAGAVTTETLTIDFSKVTTGYIVDSESKLTALAKEKVITLDENATWIVNGNVTSKAINTIDLNGKTLTVISGKNAGVLDLTAGSATASLLKASNESKLVLDGVTLKLTSAANAEANLVYSGGLTVDADNASIALTQNHKTGIQGGASAISTLSNTSTVFDLTKSSMTVNGNGGVQCIMIKAVSSTVTANVGDASVAAYMDLEDSKITASNINVYAANLENSTVTASNNLGVYSGTTAPVYDGYRFTVNTVSVDADSSISAETVYNGIYNAGTDGITKGTSAVKFTGEGQVSGTFTSHGATATDASATFDLNGVIITDATHMVGFSAVEKRRDSVPDAIIAGCDMILFANDVEEDVSFLRAAYESGRLTEERLSDALHRILGLKAHLCLNDPAVAMPDQSGLAWVGCAEHQGYSAQAADSCIALVKDTRGNLPIDPEKKKRVFLVYVGSTPTTKGYKGDPTKQVVVEELERAGFEVDLCPNYHALEIENGVSPMNFVKMLGHSSREAFAAQHDWALIVVNVKGYAQENNVRIRWSCNHSMELPWYNEEVPTVAMSLNYTNHLIDLPQIHTFVNAYAPNRAHIRAAIQKLTGQSEFKGKADENVFCGRWDTRL